MCLYSVILHSSLGEIFDSHVVANLLLNLLVKEFENRSTFCEFMDK